MSQIEGVDISHFQPTVDWSKVTVPFVVLKASQYNFTDKMYATHKANARKAGKLVGSYHFAGYVNPITKELFFNAPEVEAQMFVKTVGDIQPGEFLALDYEVKIPNCVDWCKKFLGEVNRLVGFRPLIYMNVSTMKGFDWKPICNDNGLWIADPSYSPPRVKDWTSWAIHQYTIGSSPGFPGNVDKDRFNGSLEQLKKYGKQAGCLHCPIHCP